LENINGVPTVAGWHDDPEDPNFIRYSNGRAWTGERVAKDRTLTLKNDNVYRPGGSVGRMPEKKQQEVEVVVEAEPASYQPLTRKERRILESADAPALEPMSDLFEEEFEFETAPSTSARSYAPGKDEVAKRREIPVLEDIVTPLPVVPIFNGFEDVFPQQQEPEPEAPEAEDDEAENALPSLDMGDMGDTFSAAPPAPSSREDDEPSFLPVLGGSSSMAEASLPSLPSMSREDDEPEENEEYEFFTSGVNNDSNDIEEANDVEDDFVAIAPVAAVRRSYEAPPAEVKEEPKKPSKPVEDSAVLPPVIPTAPKTAKPVDSVTDATNGNLADDEAPSFGFTSKLGRSFKQDDGAEPAPAAPRSAPKAEEKRPEPEVDEDDEDSEYEEEPRDGIGGRIKSLFGRGKSQDVLDYDYDDENSDGPDEPKAEPKPEVKAAVASLPKTAPSVADDDTESDEPEEETRLKTGLFSSRQDKEDAAVEVELVGRLNRLAKRVASLKKEEIEVLARVEAAKLQEKELNELIIQAHETHELLDQLAKTRQKELEGNRDEKEDTRFIEFLDSHGSPDVEDEPEFASSDESTVALPVIKGDPDEEEDDTEKSSLPALKFS
jgi:hypothetical protein